MRDFAKRLQHAEVPQPALPQPAGVPVITEETLRRIVDQWDESIQFSRPRASLLSVDDTLGDMAERFLRTTTRGKRPYRDRRSAVALGLLHLRTAMRQTFGEDGDDLLKRELKVMGRHEIHALDIGVANGKPIWAAQGVSFEVPDQVELARTLKAVRWDFADVRDKSATFPLAVVALPPANENDLYREARQTFHSLRVDLVTEEKVDEWAEQMTAGVEQHFRADGQPTSVR